MHIYNRPLYLALAADNLTPLKDDKGRQEVHKEAVSDTYTYNLFVY